MNRLCLTILLLFVCGKAFSQFSMEAFLATAKSDLSLAPVQEKMNFLRDNNFNGPVISRLELRAGSDHADWTMEEYRLRITPGNPSELRANKRYYDKQTALLNTEYRIALNSAIRQRYMILIDHLFTTQKRDNLEILLESNRRLIDMMSRSTGEYTMDLGDIINAQSDDLDLNLGIENAGITLDEIEYIIKADYHFDAPIDWKYADLIPVPDILNLFNEIRERPTGEHLNLVKMDQRNALAAERYNVEKSEARRNIGFFQINYDGDRKGGLQRQFGYYLGIRIPIVNPDKPDLNRRKLALMDDEALLEEKSDNITRQMELMVLRMEHYANQYNQISEKLVTIRQQNLLSFQPYDKTIKISDLIKMNEYQLKLIDNLNKIERNIYENYLSYLDLSGLLSESPLRNYMSKNLTEF